MLSAVIVNMHCPYLIHPTTTELVAILACIHCAPVSMLLALVSMLPNFVKSACMPCLALHGICLDHCCADDQACLQ